MPPHPPLSTASHPIPHCTPPHAKIVFQETHPPVPKRLGATTVWHCSIGCRNDFCAATTFEGDIPVSAESPIFSPVEGKYHFQRIKSPSSFNKAARAATDPPRGNKMAPRPATRDRACYTVDCRGGMRLGHFSYREGLGNSLQLHSGPHLGSGRVQYTISAEQTLQPAVGLLASEAEKRGPAYVRTWGLLGAGQGQGAGAGCYRNPVAQYSSVPGSSLCSVIRAQDTSFYELESSSSQTKPSPSQVPSVGSQGAALSISACQEGAPLSEPPS